MQPNNFYLHFVTDLRRVVFCMSNDNVAGAQTFLHHANKIYEERLKNDGIRNTVAENFDSLWSSIYEAHIPADKTEQKKFAEQILTLSSIIFLRSQEHFSPQMEKTVVKSELS